MAPSCAGSVQALAVSLTARTIAAEDALPAGVRGPHAGHGSRRPEAERPTRSFSPRYPTWLKLVRTLALASIQPRMVRLPRYR